MCNNLLLRPMVEDVGYICITLLVYIMSAINNVSRVCFDAGQTVTSYDLLTDHTTVTIAGRNSIAVVYCSQYCS